MQALGILWIGDRLSILGRLCLQSYVDHGQRITLFTYGDIAGVPRGVELRDTGQVMGGDRILRVQRGHAALHADMFRLRMLDLMCRMHGIMTRPEYALPAMAA